MTGVICDIGGDIAEGGRLANGILQVVVSAPASVASFSACRRLDSRSTASTREGMCAAIA
jgi:hypothetical protein